MNLIKEEQFNKYLTERFDYFFKIDQSDIYLLEITARCKNWSQNWKKLFDDDDLRIEINNNPFPKLKKRGLFNAPAAWNGNRLKKLSQTNFYLVKLDRLENTINFIPDQRPYVEELKVYQVTNQEFSLELNKQAEDGDKRPWITLAIKDISLKNIKISASANKHKGSIDSDDLQIRIDGQKQLNPKSKLHKYWHWCGNILKGETETFEKKLNFKEGLHYIELWADRRPKIEKVDILLGELKESLTTGRVVLYKDLTNLKEIHLFLQPNSESQALTILQDGDELEILEEKIIGEWIENKSYIWHKVRWQDKIGYVLSSFVEIKGQERDAIIKKIKEKAKELDIDENLIVALAGCESRYKIFATSKPYNSEDTKTGQGIFQLTDQLIVDLNDESKPFYNPVENPFNIDQNIAGGIKYFKHLYKEKYKGDLKKAIVAYNVGPGHVPEKEDLDLSLYSEDPRKLIKCVLENKKRRNWKFIFWPLLIMLVISSILGFRYLDRNDFFEARFSEKEYLLAQVSHFPSVFWQKETSQVIFFDSQGKIVKKISIERLDLKRVLQIPSDIQEWEWGTVHLDSNVMEHPEGIFYFLVATTWSCGANNCSWILYRYDVNQDILEVIDDNLLGGVYLYPSPNHRKLGVLRHVNAGLCGSSYLEIMDLEDFEKQKVTGFKNEFRPSAYINSLTWTNNNQIEFKTSHYNCGALERGLCRRAFSYSLEQGMISLEKDCQFIEQL